MSAVQQVIDSGIEPIVLRLEDVRTFDRPSKLHRSYLVINSLDVGVIDFNAYRFVVSRTKQATAMVQRHLQKLCRVISLSEEDNSEDCYILPVYARMLRDGELLSSITEALSIYTEVSPSQICVELSADILYEDIGLLLGEILRLKEFGVKIAIGEIGDEYCPIFRLSGIPFDYAFADKFATSKLLSEDRERIAGSLTGYLHSLGATVIAPGMEAEEEIEAARNLGFDGYTAKAQLRAPREEGEHEA